MFIRELNIFLLFLKQKGLPRIESNFKNLKPGDYIELTCQVKYLPSRFDLYWTFNDKKITNANIINKINHHHHHNSDNNKKNNQNNKTFKSSNSLIKQQQLRDRRNNNNNSNQSGLVIINDKINNQTISKLRILNFDEQNKGIYRCKYEKLEAKYIVDLKSKGN